MSAKKEVDESNSGKVVLKLDKVEPDVPSVACYKLTAIAAPLMNHLKAMMQVVQDQQNEISAVKQQLYHYKVPHSISFIARFHFLLFHFSSSKKVFLGRRNFIE